MLRCSRLSSTAVLALATSLTASAQSKSASASPSVAQQQAVSAEWKGVENALGRTGQMQPGDVFKVSMPRRDIKITKDGVLLAPALALGSWVAFTGTGQNTMVMGDLVLSEQEIEPVMLKLQQEGIDETALHNHLIGETPRVMYLHIAGRGDPVKLGTALRDALALTNTPPPSSGSSSAPAVELDTKAIDNALGHAGKLNGSVFQVSVPRNEAITDGGMTVPPSMGVSTALNFQPTGGGKAAITGDFVLTKDEVVPVSRALRQNGIDVTAIHSHMLQDEPHLYFMHFWANDDAAKLARGLRQALDLTNSKKPSK